MEDAKDRRKIYEVSKRIVTCVNVIMVIAGLILTGLSIWALTESRGFFANGLYLTTGIFLLISGVGCIAISGIGLAGAKSKIPGYLVLYISFMSFFLILILIAIITAFVLRAQFQSRMREKLFETAKRYYDSSLIQDSWDILQSRFQCCGLLRDEYDYNRLPYQMWSTNPEFRKTNGPRVPESCCDPRLTSNYNSYGTFRVQCQGRRSIIFRDDCYTRLQSYLKPRIEAVGFTAVAMAILTATGVIFASLVYKAIDMEVKEDQSERKNRSQVRTSHKVSNGANSIFGMGNPLSSASSTGSSSRNTCKLFSHRKSFALGPERRVEDMDHNQRNRRSPDNNAININPPNHSWQM